MHLPLKELLQRKIAEAIHAHQSRHHTWTLQALRQIISTTTTPTEREDSHRQQQRASDLLPANALGILKPRERLLTLYELHQELLSGTQSRMSTAVASQYAHESTDDSEDELNEDGTVGLLRLKPTTDDIEKDSRNSHNKRVVSYAGSQVFLNSLDREALKNNLDTHAIRSRLHSRIRQYVTVSKLLLLYLLNEILSDAEQALANHLQLSLAHFLTEAHMAVLSGPESFSQQETRNTFNLSLVNAENWSFQDLTNRLIHYQIIDTNPEIQTLLTNRNPVLVLEDRLKYRQSKQMKQEGMPSTLDQFLALLNQSITSTDHPEIIKHIATIDPKKLMHPSPAKTQWGHQILLNEKCQFIVDPNQTSKISTPPSLKRRVSHRITITHRHIPETGLRSPEDLLAFLNKCFTQIMMQDIYASDQELCDLLPKKYQDLAKNISLIKTTTDNEDDYRFILALEQDTDLSEEPQPKKRRVEKNTSDTQQSAASLSDTTASTSHRASAMASASTPSMQITHPLPQQPQVPISSAFTSTPLYLQRPSLLVIPPHQPIPETLAQRAARIRREQAAAEAERIYLLAHREMQLRQHFSQFYQAHPQYMPHIQPLHTAHPTHRDIHSHPLGQQPIPPQSPTRQEPYQYAPWQQTGYHPSLISVVDGHIEHRHTSTQESTSQHRDQQSTPDLSLMTQEPESAQDTIDGQQEPQEPYNPKKRILKTWKKDPKNKNNKDRDDNKKDDH